MCLHTNICGNVLMKFCLLYAHFLFLPSSLPPSLLPLVTSANASSLGRVHVEIFKAVRTACAGRVAKTMVSSEVREEGGREGGREGAILLSTCELAEVKGGGA